MVDSKQRIRSIAVIPCRAFVGEEIGELTHRLGQKASMDTKAISASELKNYLLQQKVMDYIYNEAVFNR